MEDLLEGIAEFQSLEEKFGTQKFYWECLKIVHVARDALEQCGSGRTTIHKEVREEAAKCIETLARSLGDGTFESHIGQDGDSTKGTIGRTVNKRIDQISAIGHTQCECAKPPNRPSPRSNIHQPQMSLYEAACIVQKACLIIREYLT